MQLRDFSRAVRTRQWAKNALLFAGFLFAGKLRQNPELFLDFLRVFLAFCCFCGLSGAAYLLNDWRDLESDRRHPIKKDRPLAAGRISLATAKNLVVFLLLVALFCTAAIVWLPPVTLRFPLAAALYFVLTLCYSTVLKHEVIIDVLAVAAGFVVRVIAGCWALPGVEPSPWIVFCTFNLALFVALLKRRAELLEIGEDAGTRAVLKGYNLPMLDTFISIAAALTIIGYSLYTFNAPHAKALGSLSQTPLLMSSIPFVVYGVFRYLWLAHSSPVGGEPEQMLRDKRLMINVALWAIWVAVLTVIGGF